MSHGLTGLSMLGDQILAYQGSAGSPSFIAGVSTTNWIETGTVTSNKSYLPAVLDLYTSACGFTSEMDNGIFTGPLTLSNNTAKSFFNHPTIIVRAHSLFCSFIAAKYFFVSSITTGASNNKAMRFGMVIKVITISTKCHTRSSPQIEPRKTKAP